MESIKNSFLELRKQIEKEIIKVGTENIPDKIESDLLSKVKYKEKTFTDYLKTAPIEERKQLIDTLLSSELKDPMEKIVIWILNELELEKKEELEELFEGNNNPLTDNIRNNVEVMPYNEKVRRTTSSTIKVTAFSLTLSVITFILAVQLNSKPLLMLSGVLMSMTVVSTMVTMLSLSLLKKD